MGCSPYFAVTGTSPLLPLDIVEATYLMLVPVSLISTLELIACRAVALQKRAEQIKLLRSHIFAARVEAAQYFELENSAVICDFNFEWGRLVLIHNTAIEKSLNHKM